MSPSAAPTVTLLAYRIRCFYFLSQRPVARAPAVPADPPPVYGSNTAAALKVCMFDTKTCCWSHEVPRDPPQPTQCSITHKKEKRVGAVAKGRVVLKFFRRKLSGTRRPSFLRWSYRALNTGRRGHVVSCATSKRDALN